MINGDSSLREFGRFRLDPIKRVLWFEDAPVNLPLKEIELLCVLTEYSGQVLTKDEILDRVWGDSFVEESNLSRHIYLLRKIFKEYGESEDLIQTVPRRGYRFTGQVSFGEAGAIVVERRTSTTTLIEIEENDGESAPFARPAGLLSGTSRRTVGLISVGALVVIFGTALAYFNWPVASGGNSEIKSIAVLPVRSFAPGNEDEELRLRITDALITRLGGMSRVAVRPTSAVLPFIGSPVDSVEVGKKLRVDAVIDSYVQREADRLRVTVQVVQVASGNHLWSEQFDGQADQILKLQDAISAKVARSIGSEAEDRRAFAKRPTDNPESYEAYLKARYFANKRDEASLRKAIALFTQAKELDPAFSEAYSGLAADVQYGKAMELDDKVGATHWLLSRSFWQQGRKDEAVKRIVHALTLDRNTELAKKIEAASDAPENAIRLLLHEWRSNPAGTNPHNLAYLSTYLNDKDGALRWLNASYDERHPWTTWAAAAPEFEVLRGEPEYENLLSKLNLTSK